jgi:hypothetical protein
MAIASETTEQSQNGTLLHDQRVRQVSASRVSAAAYTFNPRGDARVGQLRLARRWRDEGALHQALCAYADMLTRYHHTPTAEAAAQELLEMIPALERQGMVYTVLGLFYQIEKAV